MVAIALAALVLEETTSIGTGDLTTSSVTGFRTASGAFGTGSSNKFYYCIRHKTASEWEEGIGYMSAASTFVRETVLASSNSGAAVNFSSGTKEIVCDLPAQMQGQPLLHVRDEKTAGTSGGTFTSGAARTRDLNQVIENEIPGAGLSGNQITGLPAGIYFCEAYAPAYRVNGHKAKLYNVTGSADLILGGSTYSSSVSGGNSNTLSVVRGRFTLTATSTLELRHTCETTNATVGLGTRANVGETEIYADVRIWKVR